jgi:hypothetical protein
MGYSKTRLLTLVFLAATVPALAIAQSVEHPLEVFGTLGVGQVYLDTNAFDHSAAGGGVRLQLSRRFAVQGDMLAIRWNDPGRQEEARFGHEHTRVGSFTILGIDTSTNRIVRLYWLAGVSAPLNGTAAPPVMPTIGFGARISLDERYFLAPEVRALATSLFRVSVSGGIALGSR